MWFIRLCFASHALSPHSDTLSAPSTCRLPLRETFRMQIRARALRKLLSTFWSPLETLLMIAPKQNPICKGYTVRTKPVISKLNLISKTFHIWISGCVMMQKITVTLGKLSWKLTVLRSNWSKNIEFPRMKQPKPLLYRDECAMLLIWCLWFFNIVA